MGRPKLPTPLHYKVICISLYTKDLDELEAKVEELKRRGWAKANKSALIRLALAQVDVATVPIPRHEDGSHRRAPSAAALGTTPAPADERERAQREPLIVQVPTLISRLDSQLK